MALKYMILVPHKWLQVLLTIIVFEGEEEHEVKEFQVVEMDLMNMKNQLLHGNLTITPHPPRHFSKWTTTKLLILFKTK